jgi:hypothetical protein
MIGRGNRIYRIKLRMKTIIAALMTIILVLTGIPALPATEVQEAYAATPLSLEPSRINSVYGGQTEASWQFQGNPEDEELVEHDTTIKLFASDSVSELATLHEAIYPIKQDLTYTWNGKIQGNTAQEGNYHIKVIAEGYEEYSISGEVEVINPKPPAPKGFGGCRLLSGLSAPFG